MSAIMLFAGDLTDDPQLLHGRDGKPSVCNRMTASRRVQNVAGDVDVPTGHSVTVDGTTADHFFGSAGRGDRVALHGQPRRKSGRKRETGDKRTKQVVTVADRFGDLDLSLRPGATRPGQIAPTDPVEI